MGTSKRTILGAAGAVAAAATAVGVAVSKRKGSEPETWHVRPADDGWTVAREGDDAPESTHGTKKEAITAGRKVAGSRAPSTLVLHYADGRVQDRVSYEPEG